MDLLREILRWTGGLPLWQRDAVRRLFQRKDGLSSEDFDEPYSLLNLRLNLAPSGMTVKYDGNASGKSDYTYVFKCACRQVRATFEAIDRKIPNRILQRNPNNLMWYDHAVTRTGGDS